MLLTLLAALALASVHVFSALLRFLSEIPRSRFLSMAGGMSVAYVVLRLIPSIEESQREILLTGSAELSFVRYPAYLIVLLSILLFYGLERAAKRSRDRQRREAGEDRTTPAVFWLHISMYSLINLLVGYVLIYRLARGEQALSCGRRAGRGR